MYVSIYNTYINPVQSSTQQPAKAVNTTSAHSSFKEQLLSKTLEAYNAPKSFPVDYINKSSTFFNKMRIQQDIASNKDIEKSMDESLQVSSFNILKKREEAYTQPARYTVASLRLKQNPLAPKLADIDFDVQKANVANIYMNNDSSIKRVS